jgi:hypothetical protein
VIKKTEDGRMETEAAILVEKKCGRLHMPPSIVSTFFSDLYGRVCDGLGMGSDIGCWRASTQNLVACLSEFRRI